MSILYKTLIITILYCLSTAHCFHLNRSNLFSKFNYTVNSEFIDLSNQQIESIDALTFSDLKQLKLLHLETNQLTRIEIGLFKGLAELREIWLESNSLISIDRNAFVGLNNLELVCIFDNPISSFFPSLVQPLCDSNSRCNLKISEKCVPPLSIQPYNIIYLYSYTANKKYFFILKVKTLTGHTNSIRSLVVLKDGRLVSGSNDKTIRIWDASTGTLLRVLTGHTDFVTYLAVLQDGNTIASASWDTTIRIWNADFSTSIRTLTGHTDRVYSLAELKDGSLASGSWDTSIRIWNQNNGSLIRVLQGHTDRVYSLAVLVKLTLFLIALIKTSQIYKNINQAD